MLNMPNGILTSEQSRDYLNINDESPSLQQASIYIQESNSPANKMNISENDVFN
jgi:hypothetical protein